MRKAIAAHIRFLKEMGARKTVSQKLAY